ncbi:MAG: sigma 54-dependent Fis family transcriptional regulator [Deltaproteobacteria bacterium]|nr:sigma 54-dependent Fis family transcriptional regulator [Deltaproteobacteria bacterium]
MTSSTVASTDRMQARGGRLTVRSGPNEGESVEIGIEPVVVGRNASCHLVLRDPKVSSIHVELMATDRGVKLRDLGSRNGTWVGGARVTGALLSEHLSLWVGESELEFEPAVPKRVQLQAEETFGSMYGACPQMKVLFDRLARVASTELTVLIFGETGTGKEVAAQAIHDASPRSSSPFIVIDCGSIVQTLAEAALFGHERGAFTGAERGRVSPFVEAEGGTVFLDELGELPLDTQPKLLRALAERRIKPVGSSHYLPIDVRVIAATRRDLTRSVNDGSFRSDLYFRVAQLTVTVPPLRERREDIPGLVRHMLHEMGADDAWRRVPHSTFERIIRHDWPGNVRELRNAVAVALALSEGTGPVDVAAQMGGASRTAHRPSGTVGNFRKARRQTIDAFEREYFEQLARQCEGNISEMARRSGLERSHIRRYLSKFGLRGAD